MADVKEPGTLTEQGKEIARNMAEVFDISGQIWQRFLASQMQEGAPKHPDPLNTWPTFAELHPETMWDNPQQVADKTIEFWAAQQQLWQNSMLKLLGAKDAVDTLDLPHMLKPDRRCPQGVVGERAVRLSQAVITCSPPAGSRTPSAASARWTRRSGARRRSTPGSSSRR